MTEATQTMWAWLTRLHALTAGSNAAHDEVQERVALVATMLAQRFKAEAFTQRSLEYVASKCTFWPAYGELTEHLSKWWRDYGPKPLMLTAPDPKDVKPPHGSPEHDRIVQGFADLRAELLGKISDRKARERDEAGYVSRPMRDDHVDAIRKARGVQPVTREGV